MRVRSRVARALLAASLALLLGLCQSQGAETNTPSASLGQTEGTNLQPVLRACLQMQEQLQAMQLAVEQNRREAKEVAVQNAGVLSNGLASLEEAFSVQRGWEVEAMQHSNQTMLVVVGVFGALVFLTMLIIACFQWRTSRGVAELSAGLPAVLGLGGGSVTVALGPAEQSHLRLLGGMEHRDQRIHEFKRAILPAGNNNPNGGPNRSLAATGGGPPQAHDPARIALLLNQARSMTSSGSPAAAVACLDEVLSLDPNHTEALVRKGAALERLHKLNEAIECYDRAIAVDSSMTLAYLHKGGLCNRLERFKEALECYEKARVTHDQHGTAHA